jgi:hypothetical protein
VIARTLIAAALLTLAALPLQAQNKKIFRCADAAGRVTYSDEACKGGAELANDDARSDEQRRAAADVVKREDQLAQRLAHERQAAEKSAGPGGAAIIPYSAAAKAAKEPASGTKRMSPNKAKKKYKDKAATVAAKAQP